jgi:hypothetical protein
MQAAHTEIGAMQATAENRDRTLARANAACAALEEELAGVKAQLAQAVWNSRLPPPNT